MAATDAPARKGRAPLLSDDWARDLHRRRFAGERSDQLATEAGVSLGTLLNAWKRLGLPIKPTTAPEAPVRRLAPGASGADDGKGNPRRPAA